MSTSTKTSLSRTRINLALGTLFLGAFVVGSAELLVVGILNLVAKDVGVSVSTAGTLVTGYALGISIGGPLLTALTMRFGRRPLLWFTLAAYILGNVAAVIAVNFGMILVARILTGSVHGLFLGTAIAVAIGLVPPQRTGQAMATVFAGISVATVLGVPAGTAIGQQLGWRAAFLCIIGLGVVALVATVILIPPVAQSSPAGLGSQARAALAPRVLVMLGVGFLLMGGQFTAFTYLAPFLDRVTGISGTAISIFLFIFGLANAIGTFAGGRAADRNPTATLLLANLVLIVSLLALWLVGSVPVLVAIALGVWGLVAFGLVSSLQYRVITLAGRGRDFAEILPSSAVNLGIAAGALIGGWVVAQSGPSTAVLTAVVILVVALPLNWFAARLRPPQEGQTPAGQEPAGPRLRTDEVAADNAPVWEGRPDEAKDLPAVEGSADADGSAANGSTANRTPAADPARNRS